MCALQARVFECGVWHLLDMAEVRARLRSFSSILIRDCRSMRGFGRDERVENGLARGWLDCVGGGGAAAARRQRSCQQHSPSIFQTLVVCERVNHRVDCSSTHGGSMMMMTRSGRNQQPTTNHQVRPPHSHHHTHNNESGGGYPLRAFLVGRVNRNMVVK